MATITVNSPIDGRLLGEFVTSSPEDIKRTLEKARHAADYWSTLPVKSRCQKLSAFNSIVLAELDELCEAISLTTGKVLTEALLGEVYPVLDLATYYFENAEAILRLRNVVTSPFAFPGATAAIARKPYGVTALITPWNYPFQITVAQILSALYAGNAVIFKLSELCLPVGEKITALFSRLELPEGLVQCLVGDGATGEYLIDAGPDFIVFTGSLSTGRKVAQRAAQHPIPAILELGGKDAMIVFADADLNRASEGVLYGAFANSGQTCVAVERLLVEASCFPQFLAMMREGIEKLVVGHGEMGDIGAMTSARQIEIVKRQYDDALTKGAKTSGPLELKGNYLQPVLLWDVTPDMLVMQEETFGPLLPVMTFTDEAHAVCLANGLDFGLNASVWSLDIGKAERIARQLKVGNWAVNDVLKNVGHPGLPFGGVGKSGYGRYHGAEGLRSFTYPVSGLTNRSHLPKEPNWFPYSAQSYRNFKGYIDFVYGTGTLFQRIRRNWPALQAFREYSAFDLMQRWQNLKLSLLWKRDF